MMEWLWFAMVYMGIGALLFATMLPNMTHMKGPVGLGFLFLWPVFIALIKD